jgi:hypothetical protein
VVSFSFKQNAFGLVKKPPPTAAAAAAAAAPADAPSSSSSSTSALHPSQFLDLTRIACLLCQRQLKSIDLLQKHAKESKLHADNLAKWQQEQQQKQTATTTTTPAAAAPPSQTAQPPPPAVSDAASSYLAHLNAARVLDPSERGAALVK